MGKPESVVVELPSEALAAARGSVERGDYSSLDEAVSDAVMHWFAAEENVEVHRAAVQEAIDEGIYMPMDEVFDRLEARYQAMIDGQTKSHP